MFVRARLELDLCWSRGKEEDILKLSLWITGGPSCVYGTWARSLQMKVDTVVESCSLGTLSQSHQASVLRWCRIRIFFLSLSPLFLNWMSATWQVILLDKLGNDNDSIIIKCQDMQPIQLSCCYYTGWCAKEAHKNAVKNINHGTRIQLGKKMFPPLLMPNQW